jgi:hypothetical protein
MRIEQFMYDFEKPIFKWKMKPRKHGSQFLTPVEDTDKNIVQHNVREDVAVKVKKAHCCNILLQLISINFKIADQFRSIHMRAAIYLVLSLILLQIELTFPCALSGTSLATWTEVRKALEDSRRELNLQFHEQANI